ARRPAPQTVKKESGAHVRVLGNDTSRRARLALRPPQRRRAPPSRRALARFLTSLSARPRKRANLLGFLFGPARPTKRSARPRRGRRTSGTGAQCPSQSPRVAALGSHGR